MRVKRFESGVTLPASHPGCTVVCRPNVTMIVSVLPNWASDKPVPPGRRVRFRAPPTDILIIFCWNTPIAVMHLSLEDRW